MSGSSTRCSNAPTYLGTYQTGMEEKGHQVALMGQMIKYPAAL